MEALPLAECGGRWYGTDRSWDGIKRREVRTEKVRTGQRGERTGWRGGGQDGRE
jgi:hypothetical protein